jgi:predicted DNA-binding transcriptional regulator AlpA
VEALLGPGDVSEILKVSQATLRHWRAVGRGPEYLRVGRHVRYRPSAIEEWLEEGRGAAVEL